MRFLIIFIIILAAMMNSAAKRAKKAKEDSAAERTADAPVPPETSAPIRAVRAQKREQTARAEEWRAAKRKQDDAQQVHSVRMDACESKLESLRTLYEAGILDREEYAQRVSRVKAKHYGA